MKILSAWSAGWLLSTGKIHPKYPARIAIDFVHFHRVLLQLKYKQKDMYIITKLCQLSALPKPGGFRPLLDSKYFSFILVFLLTQFASKILLAAQYYTHPHLTKHAQNIFCIITGVKTHP